VIIAIEFSVLYQKWKNTSKLGMNVPYVTMWGKGNPVKENEMTMFSVI
jgi:hypothetical protein